MALTEAQLEATIKQSASGLGFLCYHTRYSPGSDPGFPDLCITGPLDYPTFTGFYEVKGPRGVVSAKQQQWIDTLGAAGQIARIVWEADLGTVMDDLEAAFRASLDLRQRS